MESSVIVVVIDGPIERAGIPALCASFLERLGDPPPVRVVLDVAAVHVPDAATLDALARLRLAARRRGLELSLSRASPRLVELVALAGLQVVLPLDDASGLEPRWQVEERKEVRRVEEKRDPGDPVA